MDTLYPFTPWFEWAGKKTLTAAAAAPGIYCLAKTPEVLRGQPFGWRQDIIYIGVSGDVRKKLCQFDDTIRRKGSSHGGAGRVLFRYPDYEKLVDGLFASVVLFVGSKDKDTPDYWRRLGQARQAECYSLAQYLEIHGGLPAFNRPDATKFSRADETERRQS